MRERLMSMEKRILSDWQVCGHWPYVPLFNHSMETGVPLKSATSWINAEVPGSIYRDLMKAGWIDDPYFEMNSLKCEWVANRWWVYRTTFRLGQEFAGRSLDLVLKGIDYKARVYLNKEKLGEHAGMFRPAVFDISRLASLSDENVLEVIFEQAPDEMSQIGRTSMTHTQKSRFGYKWDFCTRLVNIGLYDEVYIRVTDSAKFEDVFVRSCMDDDVANLLFTASVRSVRDASGTLSFTLSDPTGANASVCESVFALKEGVNQLEATIHVDNPTRWWPNGCGDQALYGLKVELRVDGIVSDSHEQRTGFRTLQYIPNEKASDDALPYTLVVNGRKVYIKGVNMTPLDMMIGTVDKNRFQHLLAMVRDCNVNLIRVWGGGDEYGLLVWQEFIQSSSGVDSKPSELPDFLDLLEETSIHAVKTCRNHICHTFWSGGNELMESANTPVGFDNANIAMLKRTVDRLDPGKMMFPSSASGPIEMLDPQKRGMNHDVHGPWLFAGAVEHYSLFNNSDSLFHSEFGCDGLACLDSLKHFLSDKNLGVHNMTDNLVWRHHGEWWDTLTRDEELFGKIGTLEDFITLSQFVQAAALGYALEANRRRAFHNSGSIIWQFNEPYPNVSCTSVVDYYGKPKTAYHQVKRAYAPLHVSMRHDRMRYDISDDMIGDIFVHDEIMAEHAEVEAQLLDAELRLVAAVSFEGRLDKERATWLGQWSVPLRDVPGAFVIRLACKTDKGTANNQYLLWNDGVGKDVLQRQVLRILSTGSFPST